MIFDVKVDVAQRDIVLVVEVIEIVVIDVVVVERMFRTGR